MKTIGLIGGMSWESTVTYYRILNEAVKRRLGGLHSAKIVLYSVDFQEIEECQSRGEWERSGAILADAARRLALAGADCLVICTNTMHKVADIAQTGAPYLPLLHIADLTADALRREGVRRVGLLGTRYTMEQDFYKSRLAARGLDVLVPGAEERARINSIIYDELCLGRIEDESRRFFVETVAKLAAAGADGVILGCTEIGLLVTQSDTPTRLFDTALVHAEGVADFALADGAR